MTRHGMKGNILKDDGGSLFDTGESAEPAFSEDSNPFKVRRQGPVPAKNTHTRSSSMKGNGAKELKKSCMEKASVGLCARVPS